MKKNLVMTCYQALNGGTSRAARALKMLTAVCCLGGLTYGLSSCTPGSSGKDGKGGAGTEIPEGFEKMSIKGTEVPGGKYAGNAELTKIVIPENIKVIRSEAFSKCPNLTDVILPENLQSVDVQGFADCPALESVKFPDGLKILCDQAFQNCPSLKQLVIPAKCYCIGISTFEGAASLTDIQFSPMLELVYDRAFANCTSLKRVLLPATVQKVDTSAFVGCTAVEELAVPQALRYNIFDTFRDSKNLKKLFILSLEPYNFPKANPIPNFPNKECTVYVPDAQVEDYRARASWSGFKEILPLSASGLYDATGLQK